MSRVRRRPAALLAAAALAAAVLVPLTGVGLAAPAAAHARVVTVEPAARSSVDAPPSRVVVRFSEPVREPVTVVVRSGDGQDPTAGPPFVEGATLTQPLRAGGAGGAWRVDFRVVGADGHPVVGSASFTVGAASGAASGAALADDGPRRSPASLAVAVLLLAAGLTVLLRSRRPAVAGGRTAAARPPAAGAAAAVLVGAAALVAALAAGGGAPQPVAAGLPDAGALVGWTRPLLRLAVDGTLVVAFGLLLGASVLVRPSRASGSARAGSARGPVPAADVALGGAVAGLGALAVALQVWVTASDIRGTGLGAGLPLDDVATFVTTDPQGRALGVQLALAVATAVLATGAAEGRAGVPRRVATALTVLAALALMPPLLVGHLAGASGPGLPQTLLVVHVLAAATWVGGLVALGRCAAVVGVEGMRATLPAWSRLALGCALAVGLTGVANVAVRLDDLGGLFTGYGLLAGLKTLAFAGLVALGAGQRRRVAALVGAGAASAVRAVLRLAAVEVVVMAGAFGIAAALARTPSPPRTFAEDDALSAAVLGYPPPPAASPLRLLTGVLGDGPALVLVVLAAALLVHHVRRERPAPGAVLAGAAAVGVLAWATVGGVGLYARAALPATVGAHLLVTVVVPVLALRAGAGRLLGRVRPLPAAAAAALLVVLVGGPFAPGVLEVVLATPGGWWLLLVASLAGGLVALRGERVPVLVAGAAACAALSWWLVGTATLVGLDWFSGFSVPYLRNFADDQRTAGFVAWFAGGLPLLALLAGRVLASRRASPSEDAASSETSRDSRITSPPNG